MSWNKGLTKRDERVEKYSKQLFDHSQWKGGITVQGGGYPSIHKELVEKKFQGMAGKYGYLLYHRYVVAKSLGRPLSSKEIVHHKDGDINNYSIDNLELTNRSDHMSVEHPDLIKKAQDTLTALKESELEEIHSRGIVTAKEAAELIGTYHSTIRRRQNRGEISDIPTRYNGRCLYKTDLYRDQSTWRRRKTKMQDGGAV